MSRAMSVTIQQQRLHAACTGFMSDASPEQEGFMLTRQDICCLQYCPQNIWGQSGIPVLACITLLCCSARLTREEATQGCVLSVFA